MILSYLYSSKSTFREFQNEFVKVASKYIKNSIIEIGAEPGYGYKNYFSVEYIASNHSIERSGEGYIKLDVTNIEMPDNSVDNYLCISVLEHVFDIQKAAKEIQRTLKPGGFLIITIPFAYPLHDIVDYWRVLPDAYLQLFNQMEVIEKYHLGEKFSTCAEVLKRPRGKLALRYIPARFAGFICLIFSKLFVQLDNFPMGYGFILRKKQQCVAF